MADAWMPGAERVPSAADGGCLKGGVPRAVWLVLPGDPARITARESAESLVRLGRPCHLVWNALTGDVAQLVPVTRAARALGWPAAAHRGQPSRPYPGTRGWTAEAAPHELACRPEPADPLAPAARDGLPGVNNEGRVCAQIGVIGPPGAAFSHGPVTRLPEIMNWLDSWRVPRVGPASRMPQAPGGRAPQSRAGLGTGRSLRRRRGARLYLRRAVRHRHQPAHPHPASAAGHLASRRYPRPARSRRDVQRGRPPARPSRRAVP